MRVFISWSGSESKLLAEAVRDWLPGVLQLVRPYFTPSDTEKGTRWGSEIAKELETSEVGILCVTRDSLHSDWIMFEAGALSKSLDKSHVCPILFGISNTDLAGPLKQFQTTEFSKGEFHKLISVINTHLGENKLPQKTLDSVFEKWWPELEQQVQDILKETHQSDEPIRSERELLVEVLELTRSLAKRPVRVAPGVSPGAVAELVDTFIRLHDEQANGIGGYQETLDTMREMSRSLLHIANKYRRNSEEMEENYTRLQALQYEASQQQEHVETSDDIPF